MKRSLRLLVLVLVFLIQPFAANRLAAQRAADCDSCALLDEVWRVVLQYAPGTPRSTVERDFLPDGGLQPAGNASRYIFKKCSLIKIDIEFARTDDQSVNAPTDRIVKVSRPYLEPPDMD